MGALLARAADLLESGREVWASLVVSSKGSTPQSPGALMLVDGAGLTHGTIGGGCVESEVRRRALETLRTRRPWTHAFRLDHDYGWDDGLICGGTIGVAVGPVPSPAQLRRAVDAIGRREPAVFTVGAGDDTAYLLRIPPRPRLYVAGAGHVGHAVARLGVRLDFEVTVFDDRGDLLDRLDTPGLHRVQGDIAAGLRRASIDAQTYCVIVTRGHRHDEQALESVIGRGAGYVGMIGSRRKARLIFDDLIAAGVSAEELKRVRSPIGLDIGSVTVEEIAVSIAAELVDARRHAPRPVVTGPIPFAEAASIGADG